MTLPALIEALGRQADQSAPSTTGARSDSSSIEDLLGSVLRNSSSPKTNPKQGNQSAQSPSQPNYGDILPPSTPVGQRQPSAPAQAPAPSQGNTSSPLSDILGKIRGGSGSAAAPSPANEGLSDIFGQILGNKQSRVSDAVSKSSGLSEEQTGSLIPSSARCSPVQWVVMPRTTI
jgi:Bacterial protein of unknown function (DUF937)